VKGGGLHGWRVLVTASDGGRFCDHLERSGALPVHVPTIAIRSLGGAPIDAALRKLEAYDWIVLTSSNGVDSLTTRLAALGVTVPSRPVWAAVGPRTRDVLESSLGVEVRAVPSQQQAAAIPDAMGELNGRRVLLVRAKRATEELPMILRQQGALVDDVAAYETIEGPEKMRSELESALTGPLRAVVFTSGSTVRGFVRLVRDPRKALGGLVIACIGPVTSEVVRRAGLGVPVEAVEPTPHGIVEVLVGASRPDRARV
jgi:uroporphyrinogen III methyltransferase/synthase